MIGCGSQGLDQLFFGPGKTMYPTSDFYFLARAAGKLRVVQDQVSRLGETSVETCGGLSIPADVVIKCTGFSHDGGFDDVMKADMNIGCFPTFCFCTSSIQILDDF